MSLTYLNKKLQLLSLKLCHPYECQRCLMAGKGIYNLLLDKGADPDAQDRYGNSVLHMVVIASQLGMYGYALRHPKKSANPYVEAQTHLKLEVEILIPNFLDYYNSLWGYIFECVTHLKRHVSTIDLYLLTKGSVYTSVELSALHLTYAVVRARARHDLPGDAGAVQHAVLALQQHLLLRLPARCAGLHKAGRTD